METKKLIAMTCALALLAGCSHQETYLQIEDTGLNVDCLAQSIKQIFRAQGPWSVDLSGSAEWISISPDNGTGSGEYGYFTVSVAYNSGPVREGTVFLVQEDTRIPLTIHQSKCAFGFGALSFDGTLTLGQESTAGVKVAYKYASGEESVPVSAVLSGPGAAGLSVKSFTCTDFAPGSGSIFIPVAGTPTTKGNLTVTVSLNGSEVGTAKATVVEPVYVEPVKEAAGLPVGWNFFTTGIAAANIINTPQAATWTPDSTRHVIWPTSGVNPEAYFTIVSSTLTNFTFNPGIQVQGMMEGDYWLAVIPVYNFDEKTSISVEAGVSSAPGSVGFYIMEYSMDGKTWIEADGAVDCTRGDDTFKAHWWNTWSSTKNSNVENPDVPGMFGNRKTYNKETDNTYHKYTFTTKGIVIDQGLFYLRLRALKYCATEGSTAAVKAGWTDVKGLELAFE